MLGDNIKRELEFNNITQKELEKKVGVTEVSICRYVRNERVPTAPLLNQIAKELNCTVEYLLRENVNHNYLDISGLSTEQLKVVREIVGLLRKNK